uniref:Uncharacterized protein n=1 Tax=Cyprinus carpio TaxID=7962 RepID=A0A8C1WKF2_CYPCA
MSSLFRSEEMCQAESVHSCISELGYLGLVQFKDVKNIFNKLVQNSSSNFYIWFADNQSTP